MDLSAATTKLQSLLGERFSRSKPDLEAHGRSETHFPLVTPDAVVFPVSTDEVSQIVRICAAHKVPVIGFGTGTALEGHTLAIRGGISVDFREMNKVLAVNPEDMDCVVQPGVTREALNEDLRATGLFFPVDPGANASIGGMTSTRASGTTAVRYGTMRDRVTGLEVVRADGSVIRTGTRARKSSAGYDLTSLFVGSEGTLGLITEITLKLAGVPEAISAATAAFPSVEEAVDAVILTIQSGIPMARIELVDTGSVRAVNAVAGFDFVEKPHLLLEFHGSDRAVAEDAERFGEIAKEFGASDFEWSTKTEDRNRLWKMRHEAYWSILSYRPGSKALVTDVCVPISRLAEAISAAQQTIDKAGLEGPILGHVGDGNFHAIILIDDGDAAALDRAKAVSHNLTELALDLGGTVTGEHGVGMGKLDYMAQEHGPAWTMMSEIKQSLDPDGIMNPGKLVRQNR